MINTRFAFTSMLIAVALISLAGTTWAQSSCSATNTNGDQNCSITCPAGQAAQCTNATGSNPPNCQCSGGAESLKTSRYTLVGGSKLVSPQPQSSTPAANAITNIIDMMNAKLATLPDHHLRDDCHSQICGPFCTRPVCTAINGKLTVQSPLIISVGPNAKLSEPNWKNIPADAYYLHQKYQNCGSIQQTQSFQHSVTLTEGDTITKTKTLVTGSTHSSQLSGAFNIGIINFGGSDQLTINTQTTFTDTETETHTHAKQETVTIPVSIPPMTQTQLKHAFIQYSVPLVFSGTITVDGQISSNLDGINLLSALIPSDSDRRFDFSGVVTNSTLVDAITSVREVKLAAKDCTP